MVRCASCQRELRDEAQRFCNAQVRGAADLNFVPKLMTVAKLCAGYKWMIRQHYRYDVYRRRLVTAIGRFERPDRAVARAVGRPDQRRLTRAFRIASYYLTHGAAKRRFFLGALRDVAWTGLTWPKIVAALSFLAAPKHFREYVTAVHGDPETVGASIVWPDGSDGGQCPSTALPDAVAGAGQPAARLEMAAPRSAV